MIGPIRIPLPRPLKRAIKRCNKPPSTASNPVTAAALRQFAGNLQSVIAAAIQRGAAAEAGRINAIRNQYVMLTRGIATPKAEAAHKIDLLKLR